MAKSHGPPITSTLRIIRKPRALSRKLPMGFSKEIRQFAAHTGLAMWAWNSLHANLFLIFWFLSARGHDFYHATAYSMWHAIQNDSTQRDMLLNVARAELTEQQSLLRRIIWLVKTANQLSSYRNIAAHTPAIFSPHFRFLPAADPTAAREGARKKFNEIKHDDFWRTLTGDLNSLSLYAGAVAFEILGWNPREPLPHRPRLRSLAHIAQIEGQIGRLAQSEAHSLRQSASRRKRTPELAKHDHPWAISVLWRCLKRKIPRWLQNP
jgi:hypothetical protein